MAEKVLHKNPRSQVRVCPHVPLGAPGHEQLLVQRLLLPIGGWGGEHGSSSSLDSYALLDG